MTTRTRALRHVCCCSALALVCAACGAPAYDYTAFRQHRPRSILVLPPLNQTTNVEGTYGYLSTVTKPLAEMGYYVFPVSLVDQLMKQNGMPTPAEMHQAPLKKLREVFGADAVLYISLETYGSTYYVVMQKTAVRATARLVDTRTGITIWRGMAEAAENTGGASAVDLVAAALVQVRDTVSDEAHDVSAQANTALFTTEDHGLLYGPYHP